MGRRDYSIVTRHRWAWPLIDLAAVLLWTARTPTSDTNSATRPGATQPTAPTTEPRRRAPMACTHCGQPISDDKWPVHLAGDYRGKHRCSPGDSGLPYGYEAHAAETACEYPCLGATKTPTS